MFRITALFCLGLVACRTTSDVQVARQATPHEYEDPWQDPAVMKRAMEYMAPGEPHQELARAAGSWDVACKLFMQPDAEPTPMAATAESRLVLGGRFLLQELTGELMGRPYEGLLVLGFDNLEEEYFSLWFDVWGTGFQLATGAEGDEGELAMGGTLRDGWTPDGRPFHHVTTFGEDGYVFQLSTTRPDGTEWRVMEMTYTRRE